MIVLFSDVHANLEAFQALLKQVDSSDECFCAGDIVGYGPNPNECCEIMRERDIPCVMGNHDFVCANLDRLAEGDDLLSEEDKALCRRMYDEKNTVAQISSRWTNRVLTEENKEYLRGLPLKINAHGITIVHGKPGARYQMLNEYVMPGEATAELTEHIEGHMLVIGHSHLPMRTTYVTNPGSVGQPRDRNWKGCFATVDPVRFKFRYIRNQDLSFHAVSQLINIYRFPYDIGATIQKIKDEAELPDTLGDRLTVGL